MIYDEETKYKKKSVGYSKKPFVIKARCLSNLCLCKNWRVWKRYQTLKRAKEAEKHLRRSYQDWDFKVMDHHISMQQENLDSGGDKNDR